VLHGAARADPHHCRCPFLTPGADSRCSRSPLGHTNACGMRTSKIISP
jgi:hypothetical protein